MLDNVKKHLEDKGIDVSVLDDFAVEENVVEEPIVEVDALTEALDTLNKAMNKKASKQETLFDMDEEIDMEDEDEEDDDADDADMEKAMDMDDADLERGYYRDAMKALAKGTDDVIANMEKRMGAVMKGLEAVLGEMKKMKMGSEAMEKSLNSVLNQTNAPRAITSAPVAPIQAVNAPNRHDMIRKGLVMLQDNTVDSTRKNQIRTAIAQLEAGVDAQSVSHIIGQ